MNQVDARLRMDLESALGRALTPQDYVVGVLRVSTDETMQASLGDQESMCGQLADAMGVPLRWCHTDKMSRSLWPRPAPTEALADAEDPHCVAIVTWESSRLMGDEKQVILIAEKLEETRTAFASFRKRKVFDPRNRMELLLEIITGWNSGTEVINLRARVHETHKEKFEAGRFIQRPPYGVRVDEGTLRVDEDEMANLRRAWHWIANEGATIYRVIERWKASGVTTRGGKEWSAANTPRTLTNRFYVGEMTWNKRQWIRKGGKKQRVVRPEEEWVTQPSPLGNIVAEPHDCAGAGCETCAAAEDLFLRANRVIESRRRQHVPVGTGVMSQRVFGALVVCARCGNRMYCAREQERVIRGKRRYERFTYTCKKRADGCQRSHSIGERTLIRNLEAWINDLAKIPYAGKPTYTVGMADRPDTAKERGKLKGQLAELAEERKGYIRMKAKGQIDDETYAEMLADVDNRIALVNSRIGELDRLGSDESAQEMILATRHLIAGMFEYLFNEVVPIERRQNALAMLLDRVEVDHPNVRFQLRVA